MPTKVYTHHRNCYCIMPFVGIILYEALNCVFAERSCSQEPFTESGSTRW